MKERISHLDVAKAISIMLIIASHVGVPDFVSSTSLFKTWDGVLNSFYVPIFFLISGSLVKDFRIETIKCRIIQIIRYLVIFVCVGIIAHALVTNHWTIYGFFSTVPTVWFLFALLWITLFSSLFNNSRASVFFFFLFPFIGFSLLEFGFNFLYVDQSLICIPFYYVGYLYRNKIREQQVRTKTIGILLFVWLCSFYFYYTPQNLSLGVITTDKFFFYLIAFSGSFFIIEISKFFIKVGWITWYGRNSIVPMLTQFIIIGFVVRFFYIRNFFIYLIVASLVVFLCGCCIPLLRNRHYDIFMLPEYIKTFLYAKIHFGKISRKIR